jgi:hypothetical protein
MAIPLGSYTAKGSGARRNNDVILERTKSVSYSAGTNKLLLDVEQAQTESAVKIGEVGEIEIINTGKHPAFAILGYRTWTAEGTMSANTYYVNHLLKPNQGMIIPDCPAIIQDEDNDQYDGTAIDNQAPHSDMYVASGCLLDEGSNITDSVTNFTTDDGDYFRAGDLIRLDNEIMEVTSISTDELYVIRAVGGSTAATHNDDVAIRLPFYNAYHDFDKYSVAQTDGQGRFKATNFFGYGRAATHLMGLTAGSVSIKFYQSGYQTLGLSDITSSTNTGLTASTAYEFDIQVDGGTNFDNLSFTTDSSNVNFGGANGVISKIQAALDAQYYTSGNLFEKKVHVGIVNGDLRFTSGSHLSTSAIALTAGSSGTAEFFGTGRIPAIGSINSAVAAKLPDDVVYDRVTYQSSPNESAFMYDDGYGNLTGAGTGTINYETGAIDFTNAPVNAEFVVSVLHTSPFSGRQNATDAAKMNSLKAIYGNMPNQKGSGELTIIRR